MATKQLAQIGDLPLEILTEIFTGHGLEPHDLAQVARVCKAFSGEATRASYLYNIEHQRSSLLILSAQQGRVDWMQKALSIGADINTVGPGLGESPEDLVYLYHWDHVWERIVPDDGKYGNPLHYAALRGDNDMVGLLLKSGANLNAPSFDVCDCLIHAEQTAPRWLPLHHALCQGHLSTVNFLLDHGAPLKIGYEEEPDEDSRFSLIHCAAALGHDTLVQRAIDMGTDPSDSSVDGSTALHYASRSWNSEAVIKCLLSAGAELDAENDEDQTPLFRACVVGNFPAAMQLLKAGADTSSPNIQHPPHRGLLHEAAKAGWHQDTLLAKRPKPQDDRDKEQLKFLRTLIEDHGLNVDEGFDIPEFYSNTKRLTPLHVALDSAAQYGVKRVVPGVIKLLLDKGAQPNRLNPRRLVPLQQILREISPSGHWKQRDNAKELREVVSELIAHGAMASLIGEDLPKDMRRWVGDEAVETNDRSMFRRLLQMLDQEKALFTRFMAAAEAGGAISSLSISALLEYCLSL